MEAIIVGDSAMPVVRLPRAANKICIKWRRASSTSLYLYRIDTEEMKRVPVFGYSGNRLRIGDRCNVKS